MKRTLLCWGALAAVAGLAHGGQLKLDQYYDSGAVFQRGAAIPVAGKDGRHVDATVKIVDAKTLSASSPQVKEPVAVRYGWVSPDATNFADAEGRPAGAFRSDAGKLAMQR